MVTCKSSDATGKVVQGAQMTAMHGTFAHDELNGWCFYTGVTGTNFVQLVEKAALSRTASPAGDIAAGLVEDHATLLLLLQPHNGPPSSQARLPRSPAERAQAQFESRYPDPRPLAEPPPGNGINSRVTQPAQAAADMPASQSCPAPPPCEPIGDGNRGGTRNDKSPWATATREGEECACAVSRRETRKWREEDQRTGGPAAVATPGAGCAAAAAPPPAETPQPTGSGSRFARPPSPLSRSLQPGVPRAELSPPRGWWRGASMLQARLAAASRCLRSGSRGDLPVAAGRGAGAEAGLVRSRASPPRCCSGVGRKWIKPTGRDTGIQTYNSLSRSKEPLILANAGVATWYSCGPTVYDHAHLGHACSYVRFDIIRRIITKVFGNEVVMVMGITDIDDKIIKRANEMNISPLALARVYEEDFKQDMAALKVLPPTVYMRVTENIPQIISFIERIMVSGHAYATSKGSVYFDVKSRGERYGKLTSVYPDVQEEMVDSDKRHVKDFALWKAAKPQELYWASPWGKGRPGWHIECSTISRSDFLDF
ncbi:receptor-type tyrosine-protein phosphatase eta-like [Platysternon megacephalum]|uniref:Receptor-type tyrosine-protein phosphatase eta-like n=1 Tax=Platysternon megacephalum TaxID=55544 RepID=A0A4D9EG21_9SAUR|nr:receptor-type tyrosine-protein phosphatase eta-like [Platysternon megacephalum]